MSLLRRIPQDGDDRNPGGEPESRDGQVQLSIEQLIRYGTVSMEAAEFLRACVIAQLNIVVCGAAEAGKTTLLNVLASFTPPGEKRAILDDMPASFEQIAASASESVLLGIAANSPRAAMQRLKVIATPQQIASTINLIVQIERLSDGSRKITHVTEVQGIENGSIMLADIFLFEQTASETGKVIGRIRPTGIRPQFMERLDEVGLFMPPAVFGIGSPRPPAHTPAPPVPAPASDTSEAVQFTAFHPKEAAPEQWYTLLVYAHLEAVLSRVQGDAAKFSAEMGGDARKVASRQKVQLARGTELRIVPEGDGLEFKPAFTVIKWDEDFERAAFRFRASADLLDQPANGDILIYTGPVEIARIRFSTFVAAAAEPEAEQPASASTTAPDNPLARAKVTHSSAQMYSRIFISYSRADAEFANAYRLAQLAAGHDVFLDTESIRTGENWQAALAKAIDNADIFQLFWSESSAASPNVRDEWDYALKHKCSDDQCAGFIRPVYWHKPMPAPPKALEHLNFRYVPLTGSPGES
jgi:hypothetical protein